MWNAAKGINVNFPNTNTIFTLLGFSLCLIILSACQTDSSTPLRNQDQAIDTGLGRNGISAQKESRPLETAIPAEMIAPAVKPTINPASRLADPAQEAPNLPQLVERQAIIERALQTVPPILQLSKETLDAEQLLAQSIALNDFDFQGFIYAGAAQKPLRNEIFGVYLARESDITEETPDCAEQICYRVEMYNYAHNLTTIALVNIETEVVSNVSYLIDTQPELPPHLIELAQQIAINAPEVHEALGYIPTDANEATMANAKTALNQTSCESSRHFCVAPTFVVDDRALWAIVDLTAGRLVGVRWTYLGDFSAGRPTETMIQREEIHSRFCQENTELDQGGWALDYILTSSDGLRVSNIRYHGETVADSIKLVDWHVSYSQSDGFGYSDGIGCPFFSSSAVDAAAPPKIETILDEAGGQIGFALVQDFRHNQWPRPCNYRYMQRYEFYHDGSFRPVMLNLGRGCGDQGTYRPILRIDLADDQQVSKWDGKAWESWATEGWEHLTDDVPYTENGYRYRVDNRENRYFIEPGRGQFGDDERGDNAYIYLTRHDPDEGDADLITLGACCNTDHRQGPELFIDEDPASTAEGDLVLWYVAQLENDDTPNEEYCWADQAIQDGVFVPQVWPCAAGPLFVRANAQP